MSIAQQGSVVSFMMNPSDLPQRWTALQAEASGATAFPGALRQEIAPILSNLFDWALDPSGTDPDHLRPAFRRLALSFRARGFSVEENLDALAEIEEFLLSEFRASGDPDPESAPPAGQAPARGAAALRTAMRTMVKETVRLNLDLEGRRHREYGDALWGFGEILSHELGNRLGAARTGVELLQESPGMDASRRREVTSLVAAGIEGALTTVDDVTAYMDAQGWGVGVALPFSEVARKVVRGLQPLARRHGVRLEVREPLPPTRIEAARLRLILSNLLLNGVRYADPERPDARVELAAWEEESRIEVTVSDNGIGIAPEEHERIFQYHQRGGVPGDRPAGSGLGLAIVREAIQQLGGETRLESAPGVGATFHLRVPVASPASGPRTDA